MPVLKKQQTLLTSANKVEKEPNLIKTTYPVYINVIGHWPVLC